LNPKPLPSFFNPAVWPSSITAGPAPVSLFAAFFHLEILRKKVRNISKIQSSGKHAGLGLNQNILNLMIFFKWP
jgi:hypothetical protein